MSDEQSPAVPDAVQAEAEKLAAEHREIDLAVELVQLRAASARLGDEVAKLREELDAPATPRAAVADLVQRLAEVQAAEGHCPNREQAIQHLRQAAGWLESAG